MAEVDDEEFARCLQQQFDREAAEAERNIHRDYHLAAAAQEDDERNSLEEEIEPGRKITEGPKVLAPDSDSEQFRESPTMKRNTASSSQHTISDSDTDEDIIPPTQSCTSGRKKGLKQPYQFKRSRSAAHPISDSDSETETQEPTPKKARAESPKYTSIKRSPETPKINQNTKKDSKQVCPFGGKCYRKNPAHFEEYSHNEEGEQSPAGKREDDNIAGPSTREYGAPINKPASKRVKEARPFGFLLTRVTGIPAKFNEAMGIHISDILSPSMGNLQRSAQFNYMIVLPWLVSQYPPQFRTNPLLIVHGFQRQEKKQIEDEAKIFPHVTLCQAKLEILYGTHHTKMMLLLYDKGLRVVIHTANLIDQDWHQKTQGVWISPVFPQLGKESATEGDSPTHFKRDLLEYLGAYKSAQLNEWMKICREHDMSLAKVHIIGSVPGRHVGEKKSSFGHMKLRKTLVNYGPDLKLAKNWPVIGQFSSIGSLGANKDNWVCGEWLTSMSACQGRAGFGSTPPKVKLIFPTKDNVRLSLEGYPAGGSIPYSINVARKQPWLHTLFHQWRSRVRGRDKASPHIKTYMRISNDYSKLAWFLVTSSNLSKAAWGTLEKNGSQLMIRSYEIGVLFIPEHFGPENHFQVMTNITDDLRPSGQALVFPVPYDLPPAPYDKTDRPWVWDIPYVDKPDSHGNIWCPP